MADKKMVRTTGFVTRFEVEDGLVVTAEGVELTPDQVEKAQKAAKSSRTVLLVEDTLDTRVEESSAESQALVDQANKQKAASATAVETPDAESAPTTETAAKSSRGGRS